MNLDNTLNLIRGTVRSLSAYHLESQEYKVKLNQNENPFDWPLEVKEEMARFCVERPWNRYPPFVPEELKAALANYIGTDPAGVVVGNGSNEILLILLMALACGGATVITCQPTFTVYRLLAEGVGAKPVSVPLGSELRYDVPAILDACRKNPGAVLVICSPNNPTGNALAEAELREILQVHTGFCIFDQAYVEFGGYNAVPLLKEFPNLIVTRTFSKAFSGAGLRLGYLIGNPGVVHEINKVKLPYNINFFSEHAARILLGKRDLLEERIALLLTELEALMRFMESLPFDKVYPTSANFFLVRFREKQRLVDWLKAAGILVRDVSAYPMLENCIRINVGSAEENEALRASLRSFFSR